MSAIPGWTEVALGDLGEWGSGGTPKKGVAGYYDGDIPWLKIGDLNDGIVESSEDRITDKAIAESSAKIVERDTLLVAMYGSIGKLGIANMRCSTNQAIAHCRVESRLSTSQFLFWRLLAARRELLQLGQGAGQPNISQTILRAFPIDLPPLNEQRRIVAKLDAIFERTRAAKARLERLPFLFLQLKRSILATAFCGDMTADWRAANPNVEPASALAVRIREKRDERTCLPPNTSPASELPDFNLPKSWFVALTANVGSVALGRQRSEGKYKGQLHPYVRVANVADDRLSFDDINEMEFSPQELEQYLLRPGDIVLSEGQTLNRLGQSAMYRAGDPTVCYQKTLNRFRATEVGPLPEYAQLYFRFCMHTGVFRAAGSITTNIAHLTQEKLRRIPFVLCPVDEQRVLVARVRGALSRLERLETHVASILALLSSVEQAALAKAFRGELVEQDSNDEPASVILKHLQNDLVDSGPTPKPTRRSTRRTASVGSPDA